MKTIMFLSTLAFALLASAGEQDISRMVQVGQTKPQIKNILGDPYEKKIVKKSRKPIWGPEEEFWDKIPDGAILEVWRYKNDSGNLNLYFTDNNDHLAYKAFASKGVVYESTQ